MHGIQDLRVIDLCDGIPGAYATKLLADAGADVVKLEPPGGDPLRRWSATGAELGDEDGALFRFLNFSKRSVVGDLEAAEIRELVAGADLLVESRAPESLDGAALARSHPGLVVLSLSCSPVRRCYPACQPFGPARHRSFLSLPVGMVSGFPVQVPLPLVDPGLFRASAPGRQPAWLAFG